MNGLVYLSHIAKIGNACAYEFCLCTMVESLSLHDQTHTLSLFLLYTGVEPSATIDQIKTAYRKKVLSPRISLSLCNHPLLKSSSATDFDPAWMPNNSGYPSQASSASLS